MDTRRPSLAHLVSAIAPELRPALASPLSIERMLECARWLPPLSATLIECHLADTQARADLAVRAAVWDGGLQFLNGDNDDSPTRFDRALPAWQSLSDLANAWMSPEGPFRRCLSGVYLEYDLDQPKAIEREPSVFLEFEGKLSPSELEKTIDWSLHNLPLDPLPSRLRRNILYAFEALSDDSTIGFIGLMYPRQTRRLRVCAVMSMTSVVEYLERLSWSGPLDTAARFARDLAPLYELACVDLDIGSDIAPSIGLEVRFPTWPEGRVLLDYLEVIGFASRAQCEALANWAESPLDERALNVRWCDLQPAYAEPESRRAVRHLVKRLNHVKISISPDHPPAAKAYLSLSYTGVPEHQAATYPGSELLGGTAT